MMIHIINGYVIDPKSGLEDYRDILIKEKKVVVIAGRGTPLSELLQAAGETDTERSDKIDELVNALGKIL